MDRNDEKGTRWTQKGFDIVKPLDGKKTPLDPARAPHRPTHGLDPQPSASDCRYTRWNDKRKKKEMTKSVRIKEGGGV